MTPENILNPLIAKVYFEQALAGSGMIKVTELLEQLRSKCKNENDVLHVLDFIDDTVAHSYETECLPSILDLRQKYINQVLNDLEEKIVEGFRQSEEAAWEIFRVQYFTIINEWRFPLALKLVKKVADKFSVKKADMIVSEEKLILMIQRRFPEVYDFIMNNAKDEYLGKKIQAHLWEFAARIQAYYIGDKDTAEKHITEGLSLSPDLLCLKDLDAAFELDDAGPDPGNEQLMSARKKYESIVVNYPDDVEGLNGLGNCFKKEKQINLSEDWYNKAISLSPGHIGAYYNKISLYCSDIITYDLKKNLIAANVKISEIIEPESKFDIYIDTGYACQLVKDYENAELWFQQALREDPQRVEAHAALGHLFVQQIPPETKEIVINSIAFKADQSFQKAIDLGNTCFDGYWGLNVLYQKLSKYNDAMKALESSYPLCPMYADFIASELENLRGLIFDKKFGSNASDFNPNPDPIIIECHTDICKVFLHEGRNEFRPEFLEKINQFEREFKEKFGITVPSVRLNQFEWESKEYNFYTVFNEVYTTIGCKIDLDKMLAMADNKVLGKLGIEADPITYYEPYIRMCWISPDQAELAAKENIEVKEPVDLIFQHLLFHLWSQLRRFCYYDDEEVMSLIEAEEIDVCTGFMQLMRTLLDLRVSIVNKPLIFEKFKKGISKGMCVQQIAYDLIQSENVTSVYPSKPPEFNHYSLHESIEELIRSSFDKTMLGQWAAQIPPQDCQEILSTFRNMNEPYSRCIVSDERTAYILSSIVQIEFPYIEFRTKRTFDKDEEIPDETSMEVIHLS